MIYEKILAKLVQAKKKTEEIHKLITSLIEELENEQRKMHVKVRATKRKKKESR